MNNETRNPHRRIRSHAAQPQGVGGRQDCPPPPQQGGGYLPICNAPGAPFSARDAAATDARLADLREMGLHPLWIIAAARIGWEPFVALWETFSAHTSLLDGRNRITLPSIDTYRRYQRNETIRTMLRSGRTPEDISEELRQIHSQPPKLSTVRRMMRRMSGDEPEDGNPLRQGQLGEPG